MLTNENGDRLTRLKELFKYSIRKRRSQLKSLRILKKSLKTHSNAMMVSTVPLQGKQRDRLSVINTN